MKTYNQFITELNKFEAAMKAGKLGVKALKRVFADPKTGAFKINTTKVTKPLANALFKKQGLKKRIEPRYEVDTADILKLRKKNKPVPFGQKDKFSRLAANRKSIHPPTADAAQAKFIDRKVELIKSKNNRRREKERMLRRMFEKGDK